MGSWLLSWSSVSNHLLMILDVLTLIRFQCRTPSQDGLEDQIVTGLMRELNDEWVETAVMIKENGDRVTFSVIDDTIHLR